MLNDRKITDWTQPVSSLDDRPQMTAAALKAAFDSNTNQIKPAVNGMIDDLTGTGGAGNIGVDVIAGVTGTTVQAMLAALKALIDLCDTSAESDDKLNLKADKTTTDKLVKTITLNADTGVFTIKTDDGTTTTIDTMLEKIPVNCYLDGQEFVLVLDDGTEQRADLSDFLTPTEFTDSSTIDFSVSGSTVTATIKNGSITLAMLESTVVSTIQGYATAAQTAAGNASTSETNAGTYRDQAQTAATNSASSASEAGAKATLSQSWAIGGTGTRQGEDTNNSKYFSQRASTYATSAQGYSNSAMEQADLAETYKNQANSAADRAEQAAEDAEAIAGGEFIPVSQKGAANGVASLDASGRLEESQKPDYTAGEVGALADPGGGTTGQILTKTASGAAWSDAPDTGVTTFNSRTGAVMPQSGDYTADMVGAVPTTRKVNGKALSADVALSAADVGAIAEPDGGTTGQILTKAESGAEWADQPETGAPLQGLPTNDIRTYPVREGQSISAGDVVNVGCELLSGTEQTFGDLSVGSIVQINENGSPVDYIVVHQGKPSSLYDDSCDGTWLLRKDIAENRFWDVGNVNTYADSDINAYLNGDWLDRYDSDTLGKIKTVKIPYCVGGGSSTVNSGANGLSVKSFLLGGYEVGLDAVVNAYFPVDGAKLSYFESGTGSSANNKRKANLNGSATAWWLRSQYINDTRYVWFVTPGGNDGFGSASNSYGVRPTLIFDSSAYLGDAPVYGPETVYKDVVAQDNVENVINSSAVTATDTCYLNEQYSITVLATSSNVVAYLIDNATGKSVSNATVYSGSVTSVSVARLDGSYFVVSYNRNQPYLRMGKVTGQSISFTSEVGPWTGRSAISVVRSLSEKYFFFAANNNDLNCLYVRVGINTNGVVGSVSASQLYGVIPDYISACKLPDDSNGNKRVCICFSDTKDSNKGKAVIATIDSANAVTFGDVVEIGGSITTNSQIINCVANDTEIYMQFGTGLFVYDFSLISLSTRSGVSGTGNPYSGALVLCAEHSVAFINSSRAYVFSFNGESLSHGDEFKYNDTSFVTTWYMSAASMDNNRVLLAYANPSNSSYGTTTILTVEGNQIAGSFIDTSSDAIALADGTGGQSIPVGFGGYCECPGVTEGDTIDSSGVWAYSPNDGWLKIVDAQEKRVITGTFTTGQAGTINSVNLGFKPSVVMVYDYNNNTNASSIPGASGSQANTMNCIRIIATETGNTKLTDTGFNIVLNVLKPLWYVAWR